MPILFRNIVTPTKYIPSAPTKEIMHQAQQLTFGLALMFDHECYKPRATSCSQQVYINKRLHYKCPDRYFRLFHDKELNRLWILRIR